MLTALLTETVDQLRRDGLATVDGMSIAQADEIVAYLDCCPRYACHVERDRQPFAGGEVSCWGMDSLLAAPHFFEWVLSYAALAESYLEEFPRLYSVNAFETYPVDGRLNPDIQEFHHDKDDRRFVALFLYLTDVMTDADGPHQYQLGTHQPRPSPETASVYGRRGTAFLSDGRGQHRGLRPINRSRVIAWARWGVSDPPASYLWDRMKPVSRDVLGARYPSDPTARESIRLVVQ